MNKFHVNVARADSPVAASVVCDGKVLDTKAIPSPTLEPVYTVQGGDAVAARTTSFHSLFAAPQPRIQASKYVPADGEHHYH